MTSLFLACAVIGVVVLLLQIVFDLFGVSGGHIPDDIHIGDASLAEGFDLFSVRSIAAGAAGFGVGGLGALSIGLPGVFAVAVALITGAAAAVGTAFLMRQMLRLESDGSLRVSGSIGEPATVYIPIPGEQKGQGKVQLTLQGRTVELAAVTSSQQLLPTGSHVVVVSVVDSETVEVIPASTIQEVLDAN